MSLTPLAPKIRGHEDEKLNQTNKINKEWKTSTSPSDDPSPIISSKWTLYIDRKEALFDLRFSIVVLLTKKKGINHLSVNVFSTKVLRYWGHYFYISNWRWDLHFTWSSKPREGLAACSAKGVPLLLSYKFWDPEYWSGPGNKTHDLLLCSQVLYWLS